MGILLSITGLFKTLLIIIGAFVLLRFIGQLMIAKNNISEQEEMKRKDKAFQKEKERVHKKLGKTEVLKGNQSKGSIEDVDYEEVD